MTPMRILTAVAAFLAVSACSVGTPAATAPAALSPTAPATASPPGPPTLVMYSDENRGYSLQFPTEYHLVSYGNSICLTLAQVHGPPGPCHVADALLEVSPAEGRFLADLADAIAAQGNPTIPVIRTPTTIAGEDAFILDDIYTYDVLRKVVLLHDGNVYEFTFVPWGEASGDFPRIKALFSTVMESLLFLY